MKLALGQLFFAESGPAVELELFGQVQHPAKYCRPGCLKLSHFVLVVGALMSLPNAKKPFAKLPKDCFPLVKKTFFCLSEHRESRSAIDPNGEVRCGNIHEMDSKVLHLGGIFFIAHSFHPWARQIDDAQQGKEQENAQQAKLDKEQSLDRYYQNLPA